MFLERKGYLRSALHGNGEYQCEAKEHNEAVQRENNRRQNTHVGQC